MKHVKSLLISVVLLSKAFGQELVFTSTKPLDNIINTNSEEVYPLLSTDSTGLYFARAFYKGNIGGQLAGQDIWYTERDENGVWGLPVNLTALNTAENNVAVGVGRDNDVLYLLNTYSNPLRWNYGIAFSVFKDGKWNKPGEVNLKFDNGSDLRGYYVTPDEDVILWSSARPDSYGKEDLYLYLKTSKGWTGPIHFDESINTAEVEISPFLSADHKTMFFSSNGHGGFGGFDIFMTKRLDDTWENWSVPVNLGPIINTPGFEAYMSTYPGGETFFVSNKDGKSTNIYTTKLTIKETPKEDTVKLIAKEDPSPPAPVEEVKVEKKEPEENAFVYTVQILALSKLEKPDNSYFNNLGSTAINKIEGKDGWTRFYVGEYSTVPDAMEAMDSLKNMGYFDAFIRNLKEYSSL